MRAQQIGLVGKMGAGKSEAAKYLTDRYGFMEFAFADPIKSICGSLFPGIVSAGKPRWLYQKVGQFMRTIDPDVWINETMTTIATRESDNILISDVRQQNEWRALFMRGYTIIKVDADEEIRRQRCVGRGDLFREEDLHHETETTVDTIPYHFLVTNNSSRADLRRQLDEIIGGVGIGGSGEGRQTGT